MTKEKLNSEEMLKTPDENVEEKVNKTPETVIETENDQKIEKTPDKTLKIKEEDVNFEIINGKKYDKELMTQARLEGWRDEDFLKKIGKEERYLEPDIFIERGKKAVPFLHKKIEKIEKTNSIILEENRSLKEMLENQIKSQLKDNLEKVNKNIKDAKEYGESDAIEDMVRKKIDLQNQIKSYEEKPKEPVQIQNNQERPKEIIEWELNNPWIFKKDRESLEKKEMAQSIFDRLGTAYPEMPLKERFDYIDKHINESQAIKTQKRNLVPPAASTGSMAVTKSVERTISNLNSETKKHYEQFCRDARGNVLKGKNLKIYNETFLAACSENNFI